MRTVASLVVLLPLLLSSIEARLNECLLDNEELPAIDAGDDLTNDDLTCTPEEGVLAEQVITLRIESASDGFGQTEDFTVVVAYGDDCDRPFDDFLVANPVDLNYNLAASCTGEVNICDRQNVPLATKPVNDSVCVRVQCANAEFDCDLVAFMEISEDVSSGDDGSSIICSVDRSFDISVVTLFDAEREFECGGGFFDDDLENGAVLSYNIRATDPDDTFTVWHANGDSCGEDIDDEEFVVNTASSCNVNAVDACSFTDVEIPAGGPDCLIVRCENALEDATGDLECNLQVDITWTGGAARPAAPVLFVALLALVFTRWS